MSRRGDEEAAMTVADVAARWLTRLQRPDSTAEDWLAFERWLVASPSHAEAYERLEALWGELDDRAGEVTAALDAPIPLAAYRRTRPRPATASRRGWLIAGAALAASLAVAVVTTANWPRPAALHYVTSPGQTRQVALADGTKVWLNGASRIDVVFHRHERDIRMPEGEAVFDVAHDPARPFVIATATSQVRVVGTQFDLRQRDGNFALTVSRGVVEVRPAGAPDASPTRVVAGQRLTQRKDSQQAFLTTTTSDAAFAWTRGQLVYSDATLAEVAADLSVSLGRPVRVADAATGRLRFSGVLTIDDADTVLRRLQSFASIKAETNGREVVLRQR